MALPSAKTKLFGVVIAVLILSLMSIMIGFQQTERISGEWNTICLNKLPDPHSNYLKDYVITAYHFSMRNPQSNRPLEDTVIMPETLFQPTPIFPIFGSWASVNMVQDGCTFAMIDGMSDTADEFTPNNDLAQQLSQYINTSIIQNTLQDPGTLLCAAFNYASSFEGKAMAALVSVNDIKLVAAIIGNIEVMIFRDSKLVAKYSGKNSNSVLPNYLSTGGTLEHVNYISVPVQLFDQIIVANDGVVNNLSDEAIEQGLFGYAGQFYRNKARYFTQTASKVAFGMTSHYAEKVYQQYGFKIRGGRPDDASMLAIQLLNRN